MAEITYQMVLSTIQTASLVVGIIYYLTIMRNNQRTNNLYTLQHRMQRLDRSHYQAWANVLTIKYETYDEWREKYGSDTNPAMYADWCYIGALYHNLGYLLKNGLIDPVTVFELYPPASIIRIWKRYEFVVEDQNKRIGSKLWVHFKYLIEEAERRFPDLNIPDYA